MTDPVLSTEPTPNHCPGFWAELEAAMIADHGGLRSDPATGLADVSTSGPAAAAGSPRREKRWTVPLIAAALSLAVVGVGIVAFAPVGSDDSAEVVAASVGESHQDGSGQAEPAQASGETLDGAPQTTADNVEIWEPDDAFLQEARFLASWDAADLSWFSLSDPTKPCTSGRHSWLRYVNPAGVPLLVADHDPHFSGTVSHFTMSPTADQVAWLVACQGQLEFFVARLGPVSGELAEIRLAWVGRGSDAAALVLWDVATVSLSALDESGTPFFVDVDPVGRTLEGTGTLTDGPVERDDWIVGATATGSHTYWNVAGEVESCDGQTLFVRSDRGVWTPAAPELDAGAITAFDIDRASSSVAFADSCPDINNARLFLGTVLPDGQLGGVRTVQLGAFTTGHVSMLDWIDERRLRIHTDNTNSGGETLRFDYLVDHSGDGGVLSQVD